ncbi:hypothetical protein DIS24_g9298 [Lasiodiplodia hormozganensis]|uniref:Rhodopsin domain-containing protein n=1 Tax=Lasiodiplodia hormozganensis TaxID=869390 RepID=A0AA39XWS9_9PEZI|nr:hypothetical protein DIS24_g9298 [Lasiodiplodia hormozganensis]
MTEGYTIHLEKDASFLREIWAWFIIGLITIMLRYVVRIRTVGLRGLVGDDYITILTLGFYTMDAVLVDIVYHTGANAGLTQAIVDELTEEQIKQLEYGSACQTAAWYSYTALIWAMKFTMLFFYKRLTFGTMQNRMIKYLFWLCGASYLAVLSTITFGCFPFQDNYRISPVLPGAKCTFKTQNLLVTVTLNVITDAAILIIPIPMLWRLKVATARKLAIAALLSSGIFVIGAAITRAALTLGEAPSALNINRWGVRETIVGIVTVQLPVLRPLFGRAFWRPGSYMGSAGGGATGGDNTTDARTGHGGSKMHHSRIGGGGAGGGVKKGYGNGGDDGAIELHSNASDVDVERASTCSKDPASSITMVELLESDRYKREGGGKRGSGGQQVVGLQLQQSQQQREYRVSRGASVSSADGSEEGFANRGHGRQTSLSQNRVFVETTYEIRTEERRAGHVSPGGDGAAAGESGFDTTVTALRGWRR